MFWGLVVAALGLGALSLLLPAPQMPAPPPPSDVTRAAPEQGGPAPDAALRPDPPEAPAAPEATGLAPTTTPGTLIPQAAEAPAATPVPGQDAAPSAGPLPSAGARPLVDGDPSAGTAPSAGAVPMGEALPSNDALPDSGAVASPGAARQSSLFNSGQERGQARGQATGPGAGQATGQVTGQATGPDAGQATGLVTGQGAGTGTIPFVTPAAPEGQQAGPVLSVILLDLGLDPDGRAEVMAADIPLTFALSPDAEGAGAAAEAYVAAGHEVIVFAPDLAGETDIASLMARLPGASGIMAHSLPEGLAPVLAEAGLGFVGTEGAGRTIFRSLRARDSAAARIRILDRAALVAAQQGGAIVLADTDEGTLATLRDWAATGARAGAVTLAPLSAVQP